jgi:hypothetical protein
MVRSTIQRFGRVSALCLQSSCRALFDTGNANGLPTTLGSPLVDPGFAGWLCAGRSAPVHGRVSRRRQGERRLAWCDQIPTLTENLLGSYSGHLCAYWHPHGSGKLLAKENPELFMSVLIPLELQRKCEKRWAARFCQPSPSAAPQSQPQQQQGLSEPAEAKGSPPG